MKLLLTQQQHREIKEYVKQCSVEVSGLGVMKWKTNDTAIVEKLFVPKQEVGPAHTDIDAASINKIMYEMFQEECKGTLSFWWHSHVNMGVHPSSVDDETLRQMGKDGHCLAMIINKKGEMSCRFYQNAPEVVIPVEVVIEEIIDPELAERVANTLKENVTAKVWGSLQTEKKEEKSWKKDYAKQFQEKESHSTEGQSYSEASIDFDLQCKANARFLTDLYKEYANNFGYNAIDVEELREFYCDMAMLDVPYSGGLINGY